MKALRKYEGLDLVFDARTIFVHNKRKPSGKELVRMQGNLGSYEDGASEVVFYGAHPFQWVPKEFVANLLAQSEPQFVLSSVADAEDFYYGD